MNLTARQNDTVYLDAYRYDNDFDTTQNDVSDFGDCNGDPLDPMAWSCAPGLDTSAPTAVGSADAYCSTLLAR